MPIQGNVTFKVIPSSAQITYQREGSDQTLQAKSGQTVALKPGIYQLSVEAERYESKTQQFAVQAGKSLTVEVALPAQIPPPPGKLTIASVCQDPAQWKDVNGWWQHASTGPGWFVRNSGNFMIAFLKQPSKNFFKGKTKRIQWIVDSQPNGDSIVYTMDDHLLHREVKVGSRVNEAKFRHGLDIKAQFTMQIDISTEKIIIRGPTGQVIDEYVRPNSRISMGKFGALGEISLAVLQIR